MINIEAFGQMPEGTVVHRISLTNAAGMQVDILTLGAILQRWILNDDHTDIVLGFDDVESYLADSAYIGAVAARYANRIAHARMTLEGKAFALSENLQGHCLHGGKDGFNRRIWEVVHTTPGASPSVSLGLTSEDGDQGFPGTLQAQVTYQLTEQGTLRITYAAQSDKTTVFNPTQHSYFNLCGHQSGNVGAHHVQVMASHYTPADETGIPLGEIAPVDGTVFDLRVAKPLEQLQRHPDLSSTQGPDHNWCIDGYEHPLAKLRMAGRYHDPQSERTLTVYTDMPGMQVYNANFVPGDLRGKNGAQYGAHHGLCLETQFYPDSPNQANFPSATLAADKPFQSVTEYRLSRPDSDVGTDC